MKIWMMTGCSSGLGKQLLPVALDVTSPQMIEAAVQRIGTHFNTIDGLINNAGYGYRAAIEEGEDATIDTLFQTNFFGPLRLIRQVLPIMRKQKSGVIINISSAAAVNTFPGFGYYGASKCALEGASSALAKECAPLGIRVMVVEQSEAQLHEEMARWLKKSRATAFSSEE